jgi:DNA-directed RNA polymerase specialized sigma24 family protein
MNASKLYRHRILRSKQKRYRTCRTDQDHEDAVQEVYVSALSLGYRRGLWDMQPSNPGRGERP